MVGQVLGQHRREGLGVWGFRGLGSRVLGGLGVQGPGVHGT